MEYFFVYILKCRDGSYYIGHTDNIEKRISDHSAAMCDSYTRKRLPVELVWMQPFGSRHEAFVAERKLKGWSRRKKEALISGGFEAVLKLSRHRK